MNKKERTQIEKMITPYKTTYQDIHRQAIIPGVCCRQQALDFVRELENLIKPGGTKQ